MDIEDSHGYLSEITPNRLSKNDQNHSWIIAVYSQFASNRDDGREYKAFFFRNDDRTVFGLKEHWRNQVIDFRKLATRVVQDEDFRKSLVSDDSDLPKVWKRH
jgi:hypothetical protein